MENESAEVCEQIALIRNQLGLELIGELDNEITADLPSRSVGSKHVNSD